MKFSMFYYPNKGFKGWLNKCWLYAKYLFGGLFLANTIDQIPFYIQRDAQEKHYRLASGTKAYLCSHDCIVELRGDRWWALGNSTGAKQLNAEVDGMVKQSEDFDAEAFFNKELGKANEAEREIFTNEMDKYLTEEAKQMLIQAHKNSN
jgi:hypothetical protein